MICTSLLRNFNLVISNHCSIVGALLSCTWCKNKIQLKQQPLNKKKDKMHGSKPKQKTSSLWKVKYIVQLKESYNSIRKITHTAT
jgi:hypothetical protein